MFYRDQTDYLNDLYVIFCGMLYSSCKEEYMVGFLVYRDHVLLSLYEKLHTGVLRYMCYTGVWKGASHGEVTIWVEVCIFPEGVKNETLGCIK